MSLTLLFSDSPIPVPNAQNRPWTTDPEPEVKVLLSDDNPPARDRALLFNIFDFPQKPAHQI